MAPTFKTTMVVFAALILHLPAVVADEPGEEESFPRPQIYFNPRTYICYRAADPAPVIDGVLDESEWAPSDWTARFIDIEGPAKELPRFETRARMLWDEDNLYFGFELEEPHLQASFTERDSYIYQLDNDIEVFIDPDSDTNNYFELELNALNTVWDLLLTKPYRDEGQALHDWDFEGLRTAVRLDGTLNDPSDTDRGWSIEIAVPWSALAEYAGRSCPPRPGDQWRVNFSRVQWQFDVVDGTYVQKVDPQTGKKLHENNWVWSPQGIVAMHYPEMWGFVEFAEDKPAHAVNRFFLSDLAKGRHQLYILYYRQRDWKLNKGEYHRNWHELYFQLSLPPLWKWMDVDPQTNNGTDFSAGMYSLQTGESLVIHSDGLTVHTPGEASQ